jgi:hypothetical protein
VLVLLFGILSSLACLVASFCLVSLVALVASSLVASVEPLVVVWLSAKLVLALYLELCRRLCIA